MTDPLFDDLSDYRLPTHLVLDGARVMNVGGADIAARLEAHGLSGRPLFRETAHRPTVLAGPWLVSLGADCVALSQGIAVARKIGKGIFWLGEPDTEVLFRHLRKLGAARMPDGQILYFRYYDPDVLAAIIPMVNSIQATYIFGPARVIALIGGSGNNGTVERPEHFPELTPGPITFEEWQIDALEDRQQKLSLKKIAEFVKSRCGEKISHKSEETLLEDISRHKNDAQSLNLTSEEAIAHWSMLNFATDGRISRNKTLRENILKTDRNDVNKVFILNVPALYDKISRCSPTLSA